jgi:hypothetical protein
MGAALPISKFEAESEKTGGGNIDFLKTYLPVFHHLTG